MLLRRLVPSFCVVAIALTLVSSADAAPDYPRNIESHLGMNYAPPCSICHLHGQTGDGTPIEPFAWSMRARGLTGSRDTLTPALDADQADKVDSDGDGITDIDELKNGTDVNSPANDCIIPSGTHIDEGQCTPGVQASPSLGCSVGKRGSPDTSGFAVLIGMSLALAARWRRSTADRER